MSHLNRFTLCRPIRKRPGKPMLLGQYRLYGLLLDIAASVSRSASHEITLDIRPNDPKARWVESDDTCVLKAGEGGLYKGTWHAGGRMWNIEARLQVPAAAIDQPDAVANFGYMICELK